MKRPLIIGAGLVGGALADRLPQATIWSRAQGFDLADENTWPKTEGHDVAFFCAAIARMNLCENDPKGTALVNVAQTTKLLERLYNAGTHSVFFSTNQVFNGETPHIAPNAPHSPLNEYGRQKAQVEQWCMRHDLTTILRLSKVLSSPMPLFDAWATQWAKGEAAEAFTDMSLAPVWIDDVIDAAIKIAEEKRYGIEQISGAEDVSYADVAQRIAPKDAKVSAISYRDKGILDIHSARYSSYQVTIGPARSVDEVLSLWQAAEKAGTTPKNL